MNEGKNVAEELYALEARLMDPLVRRTPSIVAGLLADDFVEFGSSGRIYDKAATIEALRRDPEFDGPRTMMDFRVRELSSSVMLVTYRIRETATLRSSVWKSIGDHWKLAFHQGTHSTSD